MYVSIEETEMKMMIGKEMKMPSSVGKGAM